MSEVQKGIVASFALIGWCTFCYWAIWFIASAGHIMRCMEVQP